MYQEPGNRNIPYKHTASGVTDSIDTAQAFPGAMTSLQNLVPSLDTQGQWVGRPPATLLPLSQILNPVTLVNGMGIITGMIVYGRYAVGMAVSYNFPGLDEPFVYDLVLQTYIVITGATTANCPISFLNSSLTPWYNWVSGGAPIPPISMCGIGIKIIICHPGYNTNSGGAGTKLFGYIDFTVPTAPVYDATNTVTNALPYQPQVVVNFGQRAWYFMNPPVSSANVPAVMASDVLQPLIVTNGGYSITFGDNLPLTGGGALPLQNQLGGVAQSLIVFKGQENIYQITGDFALNNIFVNSLNIASGTLSPLSIASTPFGLSFLAPDGFRMITFEGQVTPPLGAEGKGVTIPFIKSNNIVEVVAACNGTTLRVCGPDANGNQVDYYFDFSLQQWHGPHTYPAYYGMGSYGAQYISSQGQVAGLWSENILSIPAASYTEGVGTKAIGSFSFSGDPAAGEYVKINGTTITFVTGAPGALEVQRGAGDITTAHRLYLLLNSSADTQIAKCNYTDYSSTGMVLPGVGVEYKTTGAAGNGFYLSTHSTVVGIMVAGYYASGAALQSFLEGGQDATALTFNYQTALLPLRDDMRECANIISIIYGQEFDGVVWTCTLTDQAGSTIDGSPVTIDPPAKLAANQLPWTQPIVFDKMQYKITGTLTATTRIGDYYMEYQTLGYVPFGFPF